MLCFPNVNLAMRAMSCYILPDHRTLRRGSYGQIFGKSVLDVHREAHATKGGAHLLGDRHGEVRHDLEGHGVAIRTQALAAEEPYLGIYSDVPLEAGMVLGIEPLVYNTGFGFGMQNKDMFLVTETGCELLSNYSDTDQLLVVK